MEDTKLIRTEKDTDEKKQPFVEPKLQFIEPKLVKHGDVKDITAAFFGTFYP
jgi:hypothetical protein